MNEWKQLVRIIVCLFTLTVSIAATDGIEGYTPSDSIPLDTMLEDSSNPGVYSFHADNISIMDALSLFAQSNGFELLCDTTLSGTITTSFQNVYFGEAISRLLADTHCKWRKIGNKIIISTFTRFLSSDSLNDMHNKPMTVIPLKGSRIFKIDYPRLKRTGQGSSTATISSTASGEAGSIALTTADEILFWHELETQLKQLLSPEGTLVVSKMAGIIHVSDSENTLNVIQSFLQEVISVATRQVEITARIYEVALDKDHSLGIDWNLISRQFSEKGIDGLISGSSGVIRKSPDLKVTTTEVDLSVDDKVNVLLNALKEQGDVHAVSQPRIITLNNQPALIKIGTDYPFFSANVTTSSTTGQRDVEEEIRVITVGVVLSVTPQISEDGWVTLGIDPLISDLVSTEQSENGSTAPVIDVKQSSALVRLKDRTTVRISGLLQNKKREVTRKVPLLGDLPLLKYFFQWTYTKESQRELIIFITPRRI